MTMVSYVRTGEYLSLKKGKPGKPVKDGDRFVRSHANFFF